MVGCWRTGHRDPVLLKFALLFIGIWCKVYEYMA